MLNNNPLVSIVIVTYNAAMFIENTIQSILQQSLKSYEIIIIDGFSNDTTLQLVEKYVNNIQLIISEPDAGIYDAMNKGIKYARGEWIIYLNAGDTFYDNNVLLNFKLHGDLNNSMIIYGDVHIQNSNSIIKQNNNLDSYHFYISTICHQSAFISINVFKNIGEHNLAYKIIADRDFFYRAYKKNMKFSKLHCIICTWDTVGYSSKNKVLYVIDLLRFRLRNFNFLDNIKYSCIKYLNLKHVI
jgi:glycosyltransferase involved in cell wall biosynthesis